MVKIKTIIEENTMRTFLFLATQYALDILAKYLNVYEEVKMNAILALFILGLLAFFMTLDWREVNAKTS